MQLHSKYTYVYGVLCPVTVADTSLMMGYRDDSKRGEEEFG